MSCDLCEEFQASGYSTFYEWKNAKIELRGCEEHLKEIFEALNHATDKPDEKKAKREVLRELLDSSSGGGSWRRVANQLLAQNKEE